MSETIIIWHNPRCSKSRQTLKLLHDKGIRPAEIDYQKNPPTAAQIESVLKSLKIGARDLMRSGQDIYKTLNLADIDDEKKLIEAMVEHPILIERPVVINGKKAAIGRPPESVFEIL